ncbi:MAG: ABC transporter ATP-binding protein [Betaproteobacteria bacterium]|nr:ABC transporter ATP-binding protein [Betaproteobacteria bacterium]
MPSILAVAESNTPLLEVRDLQVRFPKASGEFSLAVSNLSFEIAAGERFALVGESGSGKTVSALSLLQLLPEAQTSGEIRFRGEPLMQASPQRLRGLRGKDIAMVFQEPMTALNPLLTIGRQIGEVLETHEGIGQGLGERAAVDLLERVGIDEPDRRATAYPHQLSGGQRQRALIAMALACKPALLIADEPTTALDMTLRQQVLDLLASLQAETGMAILLITHDLPMVKRFAERVGVMQAGQLVEMGKAEEILERPTHPYTRSLVDAQPRQLVGSPGPRNVTLEVRRLQCEFTWTSGFLKTRKHIAVRKESFVANLGETLGIVGESGSGKTTLGLALLRLASAQVSGEVRFDGVDLLKLSRSAMRSKRRQMQVVFQDPFSALSPRMTVGQILQEGLRLHFPLLSKAERLERCEKILEEVGLPVDSLNRYPHEFSGGQRQRIAIARAVVVEPDLLLLDEPTSALDLSIQKQILELLVRLQQDKGLTYIFISHDLSVIRAIAHRTLVMRHGSIVEFGATQDVLGQPKNEYTQELLDAAFPEERMRLAAELERNRAIDRQTLSRILS